MTEANNRSTDAWGPIPPTIASLIGEKAQGAVALSARQPVWRLGTNPPSVLRRSAQPVDDCDEAGRQLAWVHAFLQDIARLSSIAPRPTPLLGGRTWLVDNGYAWQTITYIPGTPLMWTDLLSLHAVGRLLARFRLASESCPGREQRPAFRSLVAKLQETAADSPAGRALPKGPDRKRYFLAVQSVLQGLSDQGFENEPRGVIHGDPTVRNIIVGGGAGQTAALVDFELAHVDALLSDLGYALYVNARPGPSATALSLDRFQAVVGGYHAVCPLDSRQTRLVVLLTASRGLLVVARNLSQWQFVGPTLDRVDWVIRHRRNIEQRLQHQPAEAAL